MSVVDLVPPDRRIAVRGDPYAGEIVRVDLVVDELAETVFVHVDSAGLSVMDLTVHDGGIRARFHFETGDSVVVDVVRLKVTLKYKKRIYKTIRVNTVCH